MNAQPLHMPEAWRAWEHTQHRACDLCSHGRGAGQHRQCAYAEPGHTVQLLLPVAQARRLGGHCGPEAEHLDLPGLRA